MNQSLYFLQNALKPQKLIETRGGLKKLQKQQITIANKDPSSIANSAEIENVTSMQAVHCRLKEAHLPIWLARRVPLLRQKKIKG